MVYNPKLELARTLGFEIECFGSNFPSYYDDWDDCERTDYDEIHVNHCEIAGDGSLHGGDGSSIEARTDPIKNLNLLSNIYSELHDYGMNVNDTCGLHIHVDTSDFTVQDKIRLLRFGAGIELLMYSLVDSERYYGRENNSDSENEYCVKLHKDWRHIYRSNFIDQDIHNRDYNSLGDFCYYVQSLANENGRHYRIWNGRYQWLNANVGHAPTCEFRIFSATDSYEQAQKFGMLAFHIIETVKHSTVKQIKFIIKTIYQATSLEEMFTRFFDSVGLDNEFRPEIRNTRLAEYLDNKYCARNREQQQALAEIQEAI